MKKVLIAIEEFAKTTSVPLEMLQSVGFEIIVLDGPPGKRQMTRANKLIPKNRF